MEIPSLTIAQVRAGLLTRQFSAVELAQEALQFAEAQNPITNAYLHFSPERALAAASSVDQKIARGDDPGPLAGVPIAVKDVIVTKGVRTTCGSKLLASYIPPYDATAITRLEGAGGIILGKTNCDEFAMGSSNENSAFGPVRNPLALDRVPGGSSGGSAAAVAQGTAVLAFGSDTGGSIRQPASFCGVVGVTPTYGRVSRYGLTAFASSLDHIGPLARNVADAATLLQAIAGRDPQDATSADLPVPDYTQSIAAGVKGLKLGLPREYLKDLTSETADIIAAGVDTLRRLGCDVREIALPATEYAIACYYIIATAEASSNLGALRWRALHHSLTRARYLDRHVSPDARRRLRRRVQAPHHARHLRAERRLLRRLLSEGAESPRPDRPRFRARFRRSGCHRGSRIALSRRSSWARRSTIRWPCIFRIFTPLPARWPAFRA